MKEIIKLLNGGFESSCSKTPEFTSFARKFKNALKKELATINATITAYNVGHFYVSGFFRIGENCFYFSISDVRGMMPIPFCDLPMLYRTAKNEKDYTGGSNNYVEIADGMAHQMKIFPVQKQG